MQRTWPPLLLLLLLLGLRLQLGRCLIPGNQAPPSPLSHTGSSPKADPAPLSPWPVEEEDPAFWNLQAAQALDTAKKLQHIQTAAKNLILFLGDGECKASAPHSPSTQGCW